MRDNEPKRPGWPTALPLWYDGGLWNVYRVECAYCGVEQDYPEAATYEAAETLVEAAGWRRVISPDTTNLVWICPECWELTAQGSAESEEAQRYAASLNALSTPTGRNFWDGFRELSAGEKARVKAYYAEIGHKRGQARAAVPEGEPPNPARDRVAARVKALGPIFDRQEKAVRAIRAEVIRATTEWAGDVDAAAEQIGRIVNDAFAQMIEEGGDEDAD